MEAPSLRDAEKVHEVKKKVQPRLERCGLQLISDIVPVGLTHDIGWSFIVIKL